MLLVVPNGKVKLLNALPFAPADLRRDSLRDAWQAYRAAWRTTRGSRLRAALPRRAGAAAPRQRDLGPAAERLTRGARPARPPPPSRAATSGPGALGHRRIHVDQLQPRVAQPLRHHAHEAQHEGQAELRIGLGSSREADRLRRRAPSRRRARAPGSACRHAAAAPTSRTRRRRRGSARAARGPAPRARARPCPCRAGRTPNSRRPRERSPGPARTGLPWRARPGGPGPAARKSATKGWLSRSCNRLSLIGLLLRWLDRPTASSRSFASSGARAAP